MGNNIGLISMIESLVEEASPKIYEDLKWLLGKAELFLSKGSYDDYVVSGKHLSMEVSSLIVRDKLTISIKFCNRSTVPLTFGLIKSKEYSMPMFLGGELTELQYIVIDRLINDDELFPEYFIWDKYHGTFKRFFLISRTVRLNK